MRIKTILGPTLCLIQMSYRRNEKFIGNNKNISL